MSSAIDIQIVSTPNLEKIENFLNDSSYRETIEYSANFNTKLCLERRLRLPFLDPQTGVAQNHCSLFKDSRQRMPGFREGQVYSYPAGRWRKSYRQYLTKMFRPFSALTAKRVLDGSNQIGSISGNSSGPYLNENDSDIINGNNGIGSCGGGGGGVGGGGLINNIGGIGSTFSGGSIIGGSGIVGGSNVCGNISGTGTISGGHFSFLDESSTLGGVIEITDNSKDSQKEELPKDWYYDDIDLTEMDALDEPKSPADDEYDYDPRYGNKKRKKRKPGRKPTLIHHMGDGPPRKGRPPGGGGGPGSGRGRGRRKNFNNSNRPILDPPSPTSIAEPPSFETAAAAVEHANDDSTSSDLRSFRKYL